MVQSLPQPSTLASQAKRQLSLHVNRLPLGLGASLTNSRMKSRKSTRLVPLRRSLPLHFRRALADASLGFEVQARFLNEGRYCYEPAIALLLSFRQGPCRLLCALLGGHTNRRSRDDLTRR